MRRSARLALHPRRAGVRDGAQQAVRRVMNWPRRERAPRLAP
jgi:hypothetical protein